MDATRSGGVVALVRPACSARGVGATGGGAGVIHGGRSLVQYGQPLVSTTRPSWSRHLEMVAAAPATSSATDHWASDGVMTRQRGSRRRYEVVSVEGLERAPLFLVVLERCRSER